MSRTTKAFLAIFLTCTSVLSVYCYAEPLGAEVTITANKTLTNTSQDNPTLVIYDRHTNKLGGWNHTVSFADEFTDLQQAVEHYRVDGSKSGEHAYYATTLVKKLGDWNHQHGNGIIADISNSKLLLSQIAGIELLIKIDSASSYLPTKEQIIATYGELLDSAQLSALDDENIYLSFALYGPVSATMTFNGDYLLKLNTNTQLDQWLKVTIPTSQLTTYTEENYQQHPVSLEAAHNQLISGLRIMAETASTQVVRNLLLERFDDDTPKLLKEISLSLQYIGLIYSDGTSSPKAVKNN